MVFHEVSVIKSSRKRAKEGLGLIKDAALYMIIGALLMGTAIISIFPATISPSPLKIPAILFSSIITIAAILIGAIIALLGVYIRLLPGASSLADYSERYSTAASLIKIGYLWGLILILVGIITLVVIVGIFFVIIGFILLFIGKIGLIILMFKLNDEFRDSKFLIAGILFILGIFVSLLDLIGWILVYIGAGEAIKRLEATVEIPPPPAL